MLSPNTPEVDESRGHDEYTGGCWKAPLKPADSTSDKTYLSSEPDFMSHIQFFSHSFPTMLFTESMKAPDKTEYLSFFKKIWPFFGGFAGEFVLFTRCFVLYYQRTKQNMAQF